MAMPSLANARGFTGGKIARIKRHQRCLVGEALHVLHNGPLRKSRLNELPLTIELVRVAPRALDSDNNDTSLKAVRDAVTEWIGHSDDSHPLLRWVYGAPVVDGRPRYQAARITITVGHFSCHTCGHELRAPLNEGVEA